MKSRLRLHLRRDNRNSIASESATPHAGILLRPKRLHRELDLSTRASLSSANVTLSGNARQHTTTTIATSATRIKQLDLSGTRKFIVKSEIGGNVPRCQMT